VTDFLALVFGITLGDFLLLLLLYALGYAVTVQRRQKP
jgi:hypothetical protein